ncbi:Hypothetical_protein [Hexamita inflata]|uniref:Hypothetical_protein n=1 Tax=Hexamita inflata TaxID=28002 RepID=A0AA86VAS8_9EUKA|nr:Hypothetical protein HINF_LOCUS49068 [Hexamita inflata]
MQKNILEELEKSETRLFVSRLLQQGCYYMLQFVTIMLESFVLTSLLGGKYMQESIKFLPIVYLIQYDQACFDEGWQSVCIQNFQLQNKVLPKCAPLGRQIFQACLYIVLAGLQKIIFNGFQIDPLFKSQYLLAVVLGIFSIFYSNLIAFFNATQRQFYLSTSKMLSSIIILFFILFSYSFSYPAKNLTSTWPSGVAKPLVELCIGACVFLAIKKGRIIMTSIKLDITEACVVVISAKEKFVHLVKQISVSAVYFTFNSSRPVVVLDAVRTIMLLPASSKRDYQLMDLFIYNIGQVMLALFGKMVYLSIIQLSPSMFSLKRFTQLKKYLMISAIAGTVFSEIVAGVFVLMPFLIFSLVLNGLADSSMTAYYESKTYMKIIRTNAFLYATDALQQVPVAFAMVTGKHYVVVVMGILRIIGGLYIVETGSKQLGAILDYGNTFFYFEILCLVIAVVFCGYCFVCFKTEYVEPKQKKEAQKAKTPSSVSLPIIQVDGKSFTASQSNIEVDI